MFKVAVASPDEFINSRQSWNDLAKAMKYPTIFCTWEWIHTWWTHFGSAHELVILFIYRRNELTGIMPLFLENRRKSVYTFPRKLCFCGSTRLFPDHLDIICAMDDATACLDAAFGYLNRDFRSWDILHLPFIAEDSNLFSWLDANRDHFRWRVRNRTFAPYFKIAGTFDDYLASFKSRHRYSILNRRRKLFENNAASYIKCSDNDMTECLATVFDLHARRAVKKQINSSFSGDEIFRFHVDLLGIMRHKNWVWIRFLKSGDKTIAAFYGFVFGNRVFYYQTGQDPEWHSYGPGSVIIHDAIQEAFNANFEEFNFLQGEEEYKYKWTKTQRVLYDLSVYHDNLPGRAIRITDVMKQALKKLLEREVRSQPL